MLFWTRINFKEGSQLLQNFKGESGGGLTDLEFFWEGVETGQKRVRSIFQAGADTLKETIMNFRKVIYENVEKKNILFTTNVSVVMTVLMLIFLCM